MLTVYEALSLMIAFATLVISVIAIGVSFNKKK